MNNYRADVIIDLFVEVKDGLSVAGFQLSEVRCASTNDSRLCGAISDASKMSRIKVLSVSGDTLTGWLTIRIVEDPETRYPNAILDYEIEARTEQGVGRHDMKAFDGVIMGLPKKYKRKDDLFMPFEHL